MTTAVEVGARAAVDALADGGSPVPELVIKAALDTTANDVLMADGYLLGTPANLGYMSGALKHVFDQIYEPCLDRTVGRPYGLYLHGRTDTDGARVAIEKITTGLQWRLAQAPVSSLGVVDEAVTDQCWELGAAMAATVAG